MKKKQFYLILSLVCLIISSMYLLMKKNENAIILLTALCNQIVIILNLIQVKEYLTEGHENQEKNETLIVSRNISVNEDDSEILKAREIEWLRKILQHEPYKSIASQEGLSEGYFRNIIKMVYKKIDVKNKNEFLEKYSTNSFDDFIKTLTKQT